MELASYQLYKKAPLTKAQGPGDEAAKATWKPATNAATVHAVVWRVGARQVLEANSRGAKDQRDDVQNRAAHRLERNIVTPNANNEEVIFSDIVPYEAVLATRCGGRQNRVCRLAGTYKNCSCWRCRFFSLSCALRTAREEDAPR